MISLEMGLWFVIVFLLAVSIIFFRKYIKAKKTLRNKFFLPQKPATYLSSLFDLNEFGPTLDSQIHFIGRGDLVVPGGTSDAEAWILGVLAKKSKVMFEFGTCTGKTSYLLAKNSPSDSKIYTLTLPPDDLKQYTELRDDDLIAVRNAKNESSFTKFLYSGTDVENKIVQIFCDSKNYNDKNLEGLCDLIFIDGSHAYSYVKSDTEKAFKMLKNGGTILWHDYDGVHRNNKDVYNYLNKLSKVKPLYHISGTTFVAYKDE